MHNNDKQEVLHYEVLFLVDFGEGSMFYIQTCIYRPSSQLERRNEKGEKAGGNEGEGNSKGGSERAPSLKERVNMNAEALEKMSENIAQLTNLQQNQWSNQWVGPNQWGGGYNW